jgi:hypothetical protein
MATPQKMTLGQKLIAGGLAATALAYLALPKVYDAFWRPEPKIERPSVTRVADRKDRESQEWRLHVDHGKGIYVMDFARSTVNPLPYKLEVENSQAYSHVVNLLTKLQGDNANKRELEKRGRATFTPFEILQVAHTLNYNEMETSKFKDGNFQNPDLVTEAEAVNGLADYLRRGASAFPIHFQDTHLPEGDFGSAEARLDAAVDQAWEQALRKQAHYQQKWAKSNEKRRLDFEIAHKRRVAAQGTPAARAYWQHR